MRDYFVVNVTDGSCRVFRLYEVIISGAVTLCCIISYPSLSVSVSILTICTIKYRYSIVLAFYHIGTLVFKYIATLDSA